MRDRLGDLGVEGMARETRLTEPLRRAGARGLSRDGALDEIAPGADVGRLRREWGILQPRASRCPPDGLARIPELDDPLCGGGVSEMARASGNSHQFKRVEGRTYSVCTVCGVLMRMPAENIAAPCIPKAQPIKEDDPKLSVRVKPFGK